MSFHRAAPRIPACLRPAPHLPPHGTSSVTRKWDRGAEPSHRNTTEIGAPNPCLFEPSSPSRVCATPPVDPQRLTRVQDGRGPGSGLVDAQEATAKTARPLDGYESGVNLTVGIPLVGLFVVIVGTLIFIGLRQRPMLEIPPKPWPEPEPLPAWTQRLKVLGLQGEVWDEAIRRNWFRTETRRSATLSGADDGIRTRDPILGRFKEPPQSSADWPENGPRTPIGPPPRSCPRTERPRLWWCKGTRKGCGAGSEGLRCEDSHIVAPAPLERGVGVE